MLNGVSWSKGMTCARASGSERRCALAGGSEFAVFVEGETEQRLLSSRGQHPFTLQVVFHL